MPAPYTLPNIRKLFVPDPGYMIFEADLSGADAQVVAWEANDEDLKRAFRAGVKIHAKNAEDVFGDEYRNAAGDRSNKSTPKGKLYDQNKRAVHATNYTARPATLHKNPDIGWSMQKAEWFHKTWFALHPRILDWHRRIMYDLHSNRRVHNKFGARIIYFDRVDGLLAEAAAWIPQSTVAQVTFYGALQLEKKIPEVQILLQVHDSLVFQLPFRLCDRLDDIRDGLRISVPYEDPLFIPWGIKRSEVSWGDCEEVKG